MVTMANQIAIFFKSQPGDDRAERVATHINDFWEPRMRQQLARYVDDGGAGLEPLLLEALTGIRVPTGQTD